MQLALANQGDVRETISDMVWAFCTTPHGVTGRVPFVDIRGRGPGTKLVPAWLKGVLCDDVGANDLDKSPKRIARQAGLRVEVGDWVKVKSERVQGGLIKFRGPFRVQRVGTYFEIMENGERWNFRNVALYQKNGVFEGNSGEGCSGMVFMGDDDEVVSERSGVSLDGCIGRQNGELVGSESGDDSVPGDVGSERGVDPLLEKRVRGPPFYLKDFVR
ncbi:hypothetical protein NDU88_003290 [Pleurodeles waltl]|uniref:Uncharacterized protein n=1 Tax=Pleurodeles waltl TaxID=8319 RepID=A0AAV7V0V8_PLEWA|nr:hypothetical protein NDU88_003290 [Pleurodeles waltl]